MLFWHKQFLKDDKNMHTFFIYCSFFYVYQVTFPYLCVKGEKIWFKENF